MKVPLMVASKVASMVPSTVHSILVRMVVNLYPIEWVHSIESNESDRPVHSLPSQSPYPYQDDSDEEWKGRKQQ